MEVKLENLIEQIRKEGVEEAERRSREIVDKARQEARQIVEQARSEAEDLRSKAKKDSEQFRANSEASLEQAGRDLVLKVREQLSALCDTVFKQQLAQALTPKILADMIARLAETWPLKKGELIEVKINPADREKIEQLIVSGAREEAAKKIVLKTDPLLSQGFTIGKKGEDIYYDFSNESIVESLKELVNPVLARIMEKAG